MSRNTCTAPKEGHQSVNGAATCPVHGAAVRAITAGMPGSVLLPPPSVAPRQTPAPAEALGDDARSVRSLASDSRWSGDPQAAQNILNDARQRLDRFEGRYADKAVEAQYTAVAIEAVTAAVDEACDDVNTVTWQWCGDGSARDTSGDPVIECGHGTFETYDFELAHNLPPDSLAEVGGSLTLSVMAEGQEQLGVRRSDKEDYVYRRDDDVARRTGISPENDGAISLVRGYRLKDLHPDMDAVRLAVEIHPNTI